MCIRDRDHRNQGQDDFHPRGPVATSSSSSFSPIPSNTRVSGGPVTLNTNPVSTSGSSHQDFLSTLLDTPAEGLNISWPLVVGFMVVSACAIIALVVQLVCVTKRWWKKCRDTPYMLERRIRRREAKVLWRAKKSEGSAANTVDIEMQPLTQRAEPSLPLGSAPQVMENVATLRRDLNALSERTLMMFEKTTELLKDHQRMSHDLESELREVRDSTEIQNDRHREVMAVIQNLGLSTLEGDRLRRVRSQQRLPRRMDLPVDSYSSLSSQYRRRRAGPRSESPHTVLEEEEDGREEGFDNALYECMIPKTKKSS